jgi:hypothetical protein
MLPAVEKTFGKEDWENARIEITLYEIQANSLDISIEAKIYFEIDCNEKKVRILGVLLFDERGRLSQSSGEGKEWQFTPPDSNGERLSWFLCK